MTEQANRSPEQSSQSPAAYAANLLCHYSFELGGYTIEQLLAYWLRTYPDAWVRLAIVEALYQGRYKAVSVEQILAFWQRRGQPLYHFNHEFERLVCNRFPRSLVPPATSVNRANAQSFNTVLPYRSIVLQLPSLKAAAKLQTTPEIPTLDVTPVRADLSEPDALDPKHERLPLQQTAKQSRVINHLLDLVSNHSSHNGAENGNHLPTASNGKAASPGATESNRFSSANGDGIQRSLEPEMTDVDLIAAQFGVALLFAGMGLPADQVKPKLRLELAALCQTQWLDIPNVKDPIHQFIPDSGSSDFHTKLKSVAQPDEKISGNS